MYSLLCMSGERLRTVVSPFSRRINSRTVLLVMGGLWCVAGLIAIPIPIGRNYMTRQWADYYEVRILTDL